MDLSTSWIFLSIAITFGVLGTVSMKLSQGLKKLKPVMCLILFYLISFIALTLSLEGIDLSIVYAVWSGIGTILVAIIGFFIFNERITIQKIISLSFIIIGVLGIHLTNASF